MAHSLLPSEDFKRYNLKEQRDLLNQAAEYIDQSEPRRQTLEDAYRESYARQPVTTLQTRRFNSRAALRRGT